ncbi:MAG: nucleotide sugar dehydrogenase [Pseudomonadota bacterium]|nr:nucleotide sugar dehydrogenase [Pseudomonadota bacterium]
MHYDVCVFGLGPVGTVSAACFAKQGFYVTGVDIDPARIEAIREGRAPFVEPGIDELVREGVQAGRLSAGEDYKVAAQSDVVVIAVGTPTKDEPDLSQLDKVCAQIGYALRESDNAPVIAVRSTVPPGTIRRRLTHIVEKASGKKAGEGFHMASNPEFLREGTAVADFFRTGRVVIGADTEEAGNRIEALYREVEADERLRVSVEAAEFAKYVDNTWHALKVSFANEIGRIAVAFGGRPEETARVFLSDRRLNLSGNYLKPGFAFGGSCLPKDVRGLSWLADELGVQAPLVNSILPSNEAHIALGLNAILATRPKRVGIFGVAFKEHVDDLRESPALAIASQLIAGDIGVAAHDPAYRPGERLPLGDTPHRLDIMEPDMVAGTADTLVIMHRLPAYYELAARYGRKPVIDLTRCPEMARNAFAMKPLKPVRSSYSSGAAVSAPREERQSFGASLPVLSLMRKTILPS